MLLRKARYLTILMVCANLFAILLASCGTAPVQITVSPAASTSIWPSTAPETLTTPDFEVALSPQTPEPGTGSTPTFVPSPELTRTATQAPAHLFATPAGSFSEFSSPDGKWIVFVRNKDLKVVQGDGKITWTLENKQWQAKYLRLIDWSADGRYLYFAAQRTVINGIVAFVDGFTLERLDLETGSVKEILPASFYTFSMSISPDGDELAYIFQGKSPLEVHVRSLSGSEEQVVKLDRDLVYGGKMLWSADQKTLLLTAATDPKKTLLHSLVKIELPAGTPATLVRADKRFLTAVRWGQDGRVLVTEQNRNYWWLDVYSGKLEMVTATPGP